MGTAGFSVSRPYDGLNQAGAGLGVRDCDERSDDWERVTGWERIQG